MDTSQLALLQAMPIFGAIRDETLEFLLAQAGRRQVAAGDWFVREGEPGDHMFVLERGAAEVIKSWQGREVLLHKLERGDCFGEMALLDLHPRSASVRATQDCAAIELAPEHLLALYEQDAGQFALIQMNLGRELCRRLRAADELLFKARMHRP